MFSGNSAIEGSINSTGDDFNPRSGENNTGKPYDEALNNQVIDTLGDNSLSQSSEYDEDKTTNDQTHLLEDDEEPIAAEPEKSTSKSGAYWTANFSIALLTAIVTAIFAFLGGGDIGTKLLSDWGLMWKTLGELGTRYEAVSSFIASILVNVPINMYSVLPVLIAVGFMLYEMVLISSYRDNPWALSWASNNILSLIFGGISAVLQYALTRQALDPISQIAETTIWKIPVEILLYLFIIFPSIVLTFATRTMGVEQISNRAFHTPSKNLNVFIRFLNNLAYRKKLKQIKISIKPNATEEELETLNIAKNAEEAAIKFAKRTQEMIHTGEIEVEKPHLGLYVATIALQILLVGLTLYFTWPVMAKKGIDGIVYLSAGHIANRLGWDLPIVRQTTGYLIALATECYFGYINSQLPSEGPKYMRGIFANGYNCVGSTDPKIPAKIWRGILKALRETDPNDPLLTRVIQVFVKYENKNKGPGNKESDGWLEKLKAWFTPARLKAWSRMIGHAILGWALWKSQNSGKAMTRQAIFDTNGDGINYLNLSNVEYYIVGAGTTYVVVNLNGAALFYNSENREDTIPENNEFTLKNAQATFALNPRELKNSLSKAIKDFGIFEGKKPTVEVQSVEEGQELEERNNVDDEDKLAHGTNKLG